MERTTSRGRPALRHTAIRLDLDTIDWLEVDAAANCRSVAGSIRYYLDRARIAQQVAA